MTPGIRQILPWKRFWCPLGATIHCGLSGEGFLTDPEDEMGKMFNPSIREIGQLLDVPCLILCGEPGLGKTTTLETIRPSLLSRLSSPQNLIWVEMRSVPDAATFTRRVFETAAWKSWQSGNERLTLVVDGVDEGLVKVPDFIPFLSREIKDTPLDRLQLILVCRTREWPIAAGDQLLALWSLKREDAVWELCPLRKGDAAIAAKAQGLDPETFIRGLYANETVGLAARPVTLFFLLKEHDFRGTRAALYTRGCRRLCEEHDRVRIDILKRLGAAPTNTEHVYWAAARIAYALVLGGKSAVFTGPREEITGSDLHIDDLAHGSDGIDGVPVPITSHTIDYALATALFSSRGPDRFGFAHHTFAEHLAARHLSRLPLAQVRALLFRRDEHGEHIVPQLRETAAWLASLNHEFCEFVARTDPEVLLRSDLGDLPVGVKISVVAAVLESAKDGSLFDDQDGPPFYTGLKHPNLAEQLLPFLRDRSLNLIARRVAIAFAGACEITEAVDNLLAVARDATEHYSIRGYALSAAARLVPPPRLTELIPFASGEVGPDPDDDLKAHALRALVPSVWTASQSLSHLTPPQNPSFFGPYWALLREYIPRHLRPEDLPDVLIKLIEWDNCFDGMSMFHHLADRTMVVALQSLGDPIIADLVVDVWLSKARRYLPFLDLRDNDRELKQTLTNNTPIRQSLIEMILNSEKTIVHDSYNLASGTTNLLAPDDLSWLLERIQTVAVSRQQAWAEAIWWCYRMGEDGCCLHLLLDCIEKIPALRQKFSWLRFYPFDDPETRKIKAEWLQQRRAEARRAPKPLNPPREDRIRDDLARIAAGAESAWITLCHHMTLNEYRPDFLKFLNRDDLEDSPGWQSADTDLRASIREAARIFLIGCRDLRSEKEGPTYSTHAGYMALRLLEEASPSDEALRKAISEKWLAAIVDHFPRKDGESHQQIVALAYLLNPQESTRHMVAAIEREDREHGDVDVLRHFRTCWNRDLSTAMQSLLDSRRFRAKSVEAIIRFLADVDPEIGAKCALGLLPPGIEGDTSNRERTVQVAAAALALLPVQTWNRVWPLLNINADLTRDIFLRCADFHEWPLGRKLKEAQLADLYLRIFELFPPVAGARASAGAVTSREMVDNFREAVVFALAARGTPEACRELLRLADALPEHRLWLQWCYREALSAKRSSQWAPHPVEVLLELTSKTTARIVNDEDDLLNVIFESLDRFQEALTKSQLPLAASLWNYEGAGTKRQHYSPKDEEDLSDAVARWLRDDLGPWRGIVVNREVQPRRGQKTDVFVDAISMPTVDGDTARRISIVIEVKGCWNPGVQTALEAQLVDEYLKTNGLTHGLYLVGWYMCDRWDHPKRKPNSQLKSPTFEEAQEEVRQLAVLHDGKRSPLTVRCVVLDCRYPA